MATESTRDALVRAGVELLEEGGSADIGLREIARHAGVSHGAPRRWFPTHRSLLSAVAQVGLRDFAAAVIGSTETDGTGVGSVNTDEGRRAAIGRAARAYVAFAVDRPAMFALIFRHDLLAGGGSDLRATSQPLMQWFRDQLDIEDTDDPEVRATALWTSVHGIAVLATSGALAVGSPGTSPDNLVDAAIATAFRGTRRSGQARPLRT